MTGPGLFFAALCLAGTVLLYGRRLQVRRAAGVAFLALCGIGAFAPSSYFYSALAALVVVTFWGSWP
ncbi:hypothetical protein [Streptomyces alfalfae]